MSEDSVLENYLHRHAYVRRMEADDTLILMIEAVMSCSATEARGYVRRDGLRISLRVDRLIFDEDARIYIINTDDRFQPTCYAYVAPEQPYWTQFPVSCGSVKFGRIPWSLRPCGYDFLMQLLDAAEGWHVTGRLPIV